LKLLVRSDNISEDSLTILEDLLYTAMQIKLKVEIAHTPKKQPQHNTPKITRHMIVSNDQHIIFFLVGIGVIGEVCEFSRIRLFCPRVTPTPSLPPASNALSTSLSSSLQ
jgi:hypothetical protein